MPETRSNRIAARNTARLVLAVAALGVITACANVQPFSYTEIHEIPPGPGLISGDDGEFVLYRGDGTSKAE